MKSPNLPEPVIEEYDGIYVVRDDLLEQPIRKVFQDWIYGQIYNIK